MRGEKVLMWQYIVKLFIYKNHTILLKKDDIATIPYARVCVCVCLEGGGVTLVLMSVTVVYLCLLQVKCTCHSICQLL